MRVLCGLAVAIALSLLLFTCCCCRRMGAKRRKRSSHVMASETLPAGLPGGEKSIVVIRA